MIDVLPEIRPLLAEDRLNELAIGAPNLAMRDQLVELERSLPANAKNRDFAAACLAGLWLRHDFFDESHAISQDLDTVEGSYWHAILHRREPDYWNAKYWFRRVSGHPIHADLLQDATTLTSAAGSPPGSEQLIRQKTWDAAAFVDLCERAATVQGPVAMLCRRIQQREWNLLFQWCHSHAFD